MTSIGEEETAAFAPGARLVRAVDGWLSTSGDAALRAFATGCVWLGGAHALYLAALPAPLASEGGGGGGLRGLAARRAAPRARRLAVAGVLAVAAYDALRSGQQERRREALDRRYGELVAGGGAGGG